MSLFRTALAQLRPRLTRTVEEFYDATTKKGEKPFTGKKIGSGSDEDSDGSASARTNKSSKNANNDADSEHRPSKGKDRNTKSKKSKAQESADEPSRKSNKKSKVTSKSDDDEDAKVYCHQQKFAQFRLSLLVLTKLLSTDELIKYLLGFYFTFVDVQ